MKRRGATRKEPAQMPRPSRRVVRALLSVVLVLGMTAVVVNVVRWANDPAHLPIRKVQILGDLRYLQTQTLQQAVAAPATGGFFTVDVAAIRAAARSLSWVERVSVRRVWPDTIRVQVREHQAIAQWGEEGLLNERAELFSPAVDNRPQGLPVLLGPDDQRSQVLERYRQVEQQVEVAGVTATRLERNARGAWRVVLSDGLKISLGRQMPFERLGRFIFLYPELKTRGVLASADLRYSNGFALTFRPQERTTTSRISG